MFLDVIFDIPVHGFAVITLRDLRSTCVISSTICINVGPTIRWLQAGQPKWLYKVGAAVYIKEHRLAISWPKYRLGIIRKRPMASIHKADGRLTARSREVSELRDSDSIFSNLSEIWQAPPQHTIIITPNKRFGDFARFGGKTSICLVNRGPVNCMVFLVGSNWSNKVF